MSKELIEQLAAECKASVHIDINPFRAYYQSADDWLATDGTKLDHVGDIDTAKDIYVVQAYPRTPVGFISGVSNDLDELLKWAIEGAKDY